MLNERHNLKSGKNKDKERDLKEKTRQETIKNIDEKRNCNLKISCCSFQKTKAKKKEK